MTELSKFLGFFARAMSGVGSNPAGDIYFHFEFLIPSRFSQLGEVHPTKIKHDSNPEKYVHREKDYFIRVGSVVNSIYFSAD